jgi:hypothetical protein
MREGEVERGKRPRGEKYKGKGEKGRGMGVRGVREAVNCDEDVGVRVVGRPVYCGGVWRRLILRRHVSIEEVCGGVLY